MKNGTLPLPIDLLQKRWDEVAGALARAFAWMKDLGATPAILPTPILAVSIAAYWCTQDSSEPIDDYLLKRWFFANLLQPSISADSNRAMRRLFDDLKALSQGDTSRIPSVTLNVEILNGLNSSDSRYKAVMCLLLGKARHDLMTGAALTSTQVEIHHFFPKKLLKDLGAERSRINAIANQVPLSRRSNRSISDTSPAEYLEDRLRKSEAEGTRKGLEKNVRELLLPSERLWTQLTTLDDYSAFLAARGKIILDEVEAVIGASLLRESPTENVDAD